VPTVRAMTLSLQNDSAVMKTRRRVSKFSVALVFAAAFAAACASAGPTLDGSSDAESLNGAKVQITAEGGFAALSINHSVDHDTRTFSFSQGRLCAATCPAPMDSASGTLSQARTDSLFDIVLDNARLLSKDDYGITRNGADMMSYTIRLTSDGHVRTIRADDGTLPEPARLILNAVRETVSAARGR
jgi:hypothetical protein